MTSAERQVGQQQSAAISVSELAHYSDGYKVMVPVTGTAMYTIS